MAEPLPTKVTRKLYRGDSRSWTHVFTEADAPKDLTGYVFLSQYRDDLDRGNIVATGTCDLIDPEGGVLLETLPADQAELLPGQTEPSEKPTLYWDLQSTDPDGNVQTWMYAKVPVSGDVSDV